MRVYGERSPTNATSVVLLQVPLTASMRWDVGQGRVVVLASEANQPTTCTWMRKHQCTSGYGHHCDAHAQHRINLARLMDAAMPGDPIGAPWHSSMWIRYTVIHLLQHARYSHETVSTLSAP